MGGMQKLPGLGQQDEHAYSSTVARGPVSVHHVPDHSYSSLAIPVRRGKGRGGLTPAFEFGPSDWYCSFVVHPS